MAAQARPPPGLRRAERQPRRHHPDHPARHAGGPGLARGLRPERRRAGAAPVPPAPGAGTPRPEPDYAFIDLELRKKGVTRELLHQEYLAQHPDGLRRSAFCARYEAWKQTRGLTMRQSHRGGEKLFVDYAGMKAYYTDPKTGERIAAELFVATLGASSYTYAEASASQQAPDFLASHVRALGFFGGVPAAVVSDQLKSGVIVPCRYEPGPHTAYLDFAQHYGTALVPARPRSPRDKG